MKKRLEKRDVEGFKRGAFEMERAGLQTNYGIDDTKCSLSCLKNIWKIIIGPVTTKGCLVDVKKANENLKSLWVPNVSGK